MGYKLMNIVLGFIGWILAVCVAAPLFIEGYYILGTVSFLSGMAVINYNRRGQ